MAGLHTAEEGLEYFQTRLLRESEMWGAFDGQLIAFIAFAGGWIEQLYILPEWQGMGIGRVMLEIAKVKSRSVRLWTFQQNAPARQFYERHGFVPIQTTDGLGNEAKAPDVLYRWIRP